MEPFVPTAMNSDRPDLELDVWDDAGVEDEDMQLVMSDDEVTYLGGSSQDTMFSNKSTRGEPDGSPPDFDMEDGNSAEEEQDEVNTQ